MTGSQTGLSGDLSDIEPVARRARIDSGGEAIRDCRRGRSWSYREYDALVSAFADRIRARNARTVAVLMPPSPAVTALSFAAFRGVCRVAVLHRADADAQKVSKLERVDPDLLLCAPETRSVALSISDDGKRCSVGNVGADIDGTIESVVEGPVTSGGDVPPGELVLFTSGTTGEPRGVRLTARNCFASALGSVLRLGTDSSRRWLAPLSMAHTGGLLPAYRCALYGTTLIVDDGFDVGTIKRRVAEAEVTALSLVPTMLERLFESGWTPPDHLEAILLGGAPASTALIERSQRRSAPVYPTYGTTETASQIATATPPETADSPGTVGRPLLYTDVDIVDDTGESCAAGERGEIVVGGPTVTPGYLDVAATDPFDDAGRLHTRDVGYCDGQGRLWVTGRLDDRIVTGGEDVHAQTVESVLCSHPAVEAAAVVGIPDPEWGERVAALVVTDRRGDSIPSIEAHCREQLAEYERPKTITVAATIPRTASGTVDRDAVRDRLGAEAGS